MTAAPTAFALAIEEFILELRHKSDKNSEFYKQVLAHINSGGFRRDDQNSSKQWADQLAQAIDEVKKQHQTPTRSRRFVDGLGSFVTAFNDYARVFDVMIQAAPDAAMLLYGGARLVLMLTNEVYSCYETVVVILEDISYNIRCYHQYAVAYESSKEVQDLLVKSYKAIVNFWLRASRLLSTKSLKVLVSRNSQLSKEWQKYRVDLQRWHDRVKDAAQAAEAYSRKVNEERSAVKAAEQSRKDTMKNVVNWIKAGQDEEKLDFRDAVREKAAIRHPSTCEWLFAHSEFEAWLAANKNAKLWLHSRPGTGKSILASVVARTLEDKGLKVVPYFFSYNDITQKRPITALKSIAVRLLSMYDSEGKSVPDSVLRLFEADAENYCGKLGNINTALEVVNGLLKQVGRVHIIIDGLDECDDRTTILGALGRISATKTHGIVKWFFTSRAEKDIQDHLRMNSFPEIDPSMTSLIEDVRRFMTDKLENQLHIDCTHCIDQWVSKSEGNFLWAHHTLRILEGEGYTCEAEVEEALRSFPVGLKGYYERSLQQLAQTKTPSQVELARKVFMLVTASVQPLRLSEISQAVAAVGAQEDHDYNSKRVPPLELIQSLCSGLVVFDKTGSGTHDDPMLRFGHKSIRDFFLQDPSNLAVSDNIVKFFTTQEEAWLQFGIACLQYLSFARYEHPNDVEQMLKSNDHGFLRHAAAFWHFYLSQGGSNQDVRARVMKFLNSCSFWNCVAVQAYIVPHLFAQYYKVRSGYRIFARRNRQLEDPTKVHYANSLPLWLDEISDEGRAAVDRFQAFVIRWHPVLNSHPHAFTQCVMDADWEAQNPCRDPWRSTRVTAWLLQNKEAATNSAAKVHDVSLDVTGQYLTIVVEGYSISDSGRLDRWLIQGESASIVRTDSIRAVASKETGTVRTQILSLNSEQGLKVLRLDDLKLENYDHATEAAETELQVRTYLPPKHSECLWYVRSRSTVNLGTESLGFFTNAIYCTTNSCRGELQYDEDSDSGLESEDDAVSVSSVTTDSGFADGKSETHHCCMIITNPFGPPIWSFSDPEVEILDTRCAIEPTRKVAVWSERLFEVCIADLTTAQVTRVALPEPDHIVLSSPQALRKEFHFSASDDTLHYLVYAAEQAEEGVRQKLTLCTLSLMQVDGCFSMERIGNDITVEYASAGALSLPSVLTVWSSDYVYVAMPELACDPKVVRIRLPTSQRPGVKPCETIKDPIFFPSNTLERDPKIFILRGIDTEERLVLTLDSLSILTDDSDVATRAHQPPLVMEWTLDRIADWRPWDEAVDAQSEQYKSAHDTFTKLRGTFVDANQRFNVPIRGGLDWRRKAFLSCM